MNIERKQLYISTSHEERQPLPESHILAALADFAASENVSIYLVGGSVRDILLGRGTDDLDFAVTGGALDFARKFADSSNFHFVLLDEEHDTARVVFRNRRIEACPYMDFTGIRGGDIVEDLSARDLTINALAIDLRQTTVTGKAEIIDPHGGTEDLRNGLIRVVSPQSIADDPLRMLRAYRFAAVLDFTIDEATVTAVRNSVGRLEFVSIERVRDELFRILAVDNSARHLKMMDDVGLLEQIFPEIVQMKGMEQNDYHHLDVWEHSLLTLEFLETDPIPISLKNRLTEVENYLTHESVKDRPTMVVMKLAALLHDIGKPAARTMDENGRIRFFDHHLNGAEIMGDIGKRLKLASREITSLKEMVEYHIYPLGLINFLRRSRTQKQKTKAMRRYIGRVGPQWLAVLLLSFADLRATQGPRRRADDEEMLVQIIGEIANIHFAEIGCPVPGLVTGRDIMREFALPGSPTIGKLLQQVRKAQIDGEVTTRAEAIEMVRGILLRD